MKKFAIASFVILITLAFGSVLYGAENDQQSTNMLRGADVIGMQVLSQDGEKIGKIKHVTVDEDTGEIQFITLSKGGLLGVGGSDIAVPRDALAFKQQSAILTVETKLLENAPKQAGMSDEEFTRDLQNYYGVSPAWQDSGTGTDMNESESNDIQE